MTSQFLQKYKLQDFPHL